MVGGSPGALLSPGSMVGGSPGALLSPGSMGWGLLGSPVVTRIDTAELLGVPCSRCCDRWFEDPSGSPAVTTFGIPMGVPAFRADTASKGPWCCLRTAVKNSPTLPALVRFASQERTSRQ